MPPPTPGLINLDDTTPSAPAGAFANVKWQISNSFTEVVNFDGELITVQAANVSAYISTSSGGGGSTAAVAVIPLAPSAPGNFTVPHGLGVVPAFVIVQMESGGSIWEQSVPFDATNLYLTASAPGIVGYASVWLGAANAEIALAPSAPGNFTVPHGLSATPGLSLIQMTSPGAIWFQQPTPWDATNLYLTAAAGGITGKAEVWAQIPNLAVNGKATIPIAPSGPGAFSVAHGLGTSPELVLVRMKSAGAIWLQIPPWDATNVYLVASAPSLLADLDIWTGSTGASSVPIIVVSAIAGGPAGLQLVMIFTAVSNMSFPANFSGSYGSLGTNPTATATYTINLNGTSVGTISISTGGAFTFTSAGGSPVSMVAGDRLTIVAQSVPDATLTDVGFSLVAARV